jgi:phospholipid transport system substrate-binding protein
MHTARTLRLLIVIGFAAFASLRAAPVDEARTALVAGIDEVSAALNSNPDRKDFINVLDTLVDKHFAFATTTRLSVGPAWRDLTTEQQTRLTTLFGQLVIRTYADRVTGQTRPEIIYGKPLELKPGRIEIPTTTKTGGQTYSVAYRLELVPASNPARWRVYDVIGEGVSLIANYRSQFEPILEKSGPQGLMKTLETKLADATAR